MNNDDVLKFKERYKTYWRDRSDAYWLYRLLQEVWELSLSLAGLHKDIPELELIEIASICMNWLEKRADDERG